ncbi:MAG TPA: hypothetical protein DCP06_00515 [Lachnospiraceae bacterium]|nr:hypothetical protein [Lachnospiraceae bacterium]
MTQEAGIKMARYFGGIIENRDAISTQHARRVGMISYVLIAKVKSLFPEYHLTEQDIRMISSAATMHDIGKLKLPDRIVNKATRLTEDEYEFYKSHTHKGKKIFDEVVRHLPKDDPDRVFFKCCSVICQNHHERFDGGGYPKQLKGDKIPIGAQVVGLADAYDDAVSDRLYKKALPRLEVYNMVMSGELGAFSPRLIHAFVQSRSSIEELMSREDKK